LGSSFGNNRVKFNQILSFAILVLLIGCNSLAEPSPTELVSPSSFSSVETSTPLPSATLTTVPLFTDIVCEPSSNPFVMTSTIGETEYAASLFPNITIARVCKLTGHIVRGEIYRQQITEGLVFCLVPSGIFAEVPDEGWSIVISDSLPSSCDFRSKDYVNFGPIVTPPRHGNLWFDVYGWHFRNKENTGENDGSVNTPQKERYFNFVFNREDYEIVWHGERCSQWRIDTDCAMATQSSMKSSEVPRSRAKFTITELELGNLVPNSLAWIDYMEFMVEVYLPAE
jgi:hypothetical protein